MASIPYNVVSAFLNCKTARRGAFRSTGRDLLSYGLLIAHWEDGEIHIDLSKRVKMPYSPSATTNIHLHACQGLTGVEGAITKVRPGVWTVSAPGVMLHGLERCLD